MNECAFCSTSSLVFSAIHVRLNFFFLMFIYFWNRETEHEWGRGRERGRHRIKSRLQALSCQHRAQRGARTHKPWDHDLSWSRTVNRLSHPDALLLFYFNEKISPKSAQKHPGVDSCVDAQLERAHRQHPLLARLLDPLSTVIWFLRHFRFGTPVPGMVIRDGFQDSGLAGVVSCQGRGWCRCSV